MCNTYLALFLFISILAISESFCCLSFVFILTKGKNKGSVTANFFIGIVYN